MAVTGVVYGDIVVGQARYRVEDFPVTAAGRPAALVPSRLLNAAYHVVPFTGRGDELDDLTNCWRDIPDGWAVRLLHGPGGQGKTRLAGELARRSLEAGWRVVAAHHVSAGIPSPDPARSGAAPGGRGLLVVIDYAERWPPSHLLAVLSDPLLRPAGLPVRVLLLARPAGYWWDGICHDLDNAHATTDTRRLGPLADTPTERAAVFVAARAAFAEALAVPGTDTLPLPDLHGNAYRQVLSVHMAALAAVDAHHTGGTAPTDPHHLSAYLLNREAKHWQALQDGGRVQTGPRTLARAAYVATLARAQPYDTAVAALARVGIGEPVQVIDDHAVAYPPTDPDTVLAPLYPDRLGEDFLALTTPGHRVGDHPPDAWATDKPQRLLAPTDGTDPPYAPAAVTVLVETARRWPHLADRVLYPLLRDHPQLAVAAGAATLTRLADLPDVDIAVLEAIESLLPNGPHVDLDTATAAIATRLTGHRLAHTTDPAQQARLYTTLGYRLANAGRREEALAATVKAVDVRRRLAATNPAAFEPGLATALNNLGIMLSYLGRREDALTATVEAVGIRLRLAATNPAAEPDLATALNSLGMMLSDLGRREDALTATAYAVDIYRRLAATNPAAFEPGLATALNNLGARLSNLGRREEALTATADAVDIRRRLAATNPAAFEPDLATALNNLGIMLSNLGRREEALTATADAVDIRRRLAATNPAAF
ncbi:tetratricopeptide repeat protein, partial [Micromonospora sp. NPDC048999]|uniref:tetratricopeptide repeat protein n=1 Tax=Micromonospora sp. NPDC048999 TaxID=3155391 RepID=UPI0033C885EA